MTNVYLVITEQGIFRAFVDDAERAHETARTVEAVVVEVPILADYRPDQHEGSGTA